MIVKKLAIYYATACYRSPEGRYYTSSGLGRYLQVLNNLFPHIHVHLLAPTTEEPLTHLLYPLSEQVIVYELPYFERFEESHRVRGHLIQRLEAFLCQHPVDCIWLRYPAAYGTVLWRAARARQVPLFIEIVGDPVATLRRTRRMSLLKKCIALAVAKWHEREVEQMIEASPAVAVSRFLRERYTTERNQNNLWTLPCGTLLEEDFFVRVDTCSSPPYTVFSVARLDHMKSLHTLVDAIAILQRKGHPVHLGIVGSGPEREFLHERAQKELKTGTWCFHGSVDDVALHKLYCSADIFALPSIHEGLGRVYYEAMARGLPVVATWVDGIVDVVLDGVTGLLVPPSNPSYLARAIESVILYPALRRRLIRNGYTNARRFTGEEFITSLLQWIRDVLNVNLIDT